MFSFCLILFQVNVMTSTRELWVFSIVLWGWIIFRYIKEDSVSILLFPLWIILTFVPPGTLGFDAELEAYTRPSLAPKPQQGLERLFSHTPV